MTYVRTPPLVLAALLLCIASLSTSVASAAEQVYEYQIKHPIFGDIGTYTNTVKRTGASTDVETRINVVVTILGNVMFRQEAERRERWTNGRLSAFHGVTQTNGTRVEVQGEARADGFVIRTPQGTVVAPADVHPTNPWSPRILAAQTMMAPATGRLTKGRVVDVKDELVPRRDGGTAKLRRYEIESDKRHVVWFDDAGVARAFRIEEGGAMIDFILVREWPAFEARAEDRVAR